MNYDKEHLGIALEMMYYMLKDGFIEKKDYPNHFMQYEIEDEIR